MRLSVELVPRDLGSLSAQLAEVACLKGVDTVNVPDLSQFELRSWYAAREVRRAGAWSTVPHVRAGTVLSDVDEVLAGLAAAGSREVLVVSGDEGPGQVGAAGADHATGTVTTPDGAQGESRAIVALRMLKAADPGLRVYGALDPYRAGFAAELAYAEAKLAAGADGLFTQPFFDLRLLQVWRELMAGADVFWGVTSVTSQRSQRYWLSRNRAVFPAGFEPTLPWHRDLAARVIDDVGSSGGNLYFMPIRVGIVDWLGELLG